LPVALLNLSGEVNGKANLLYWTTATEKNNMGFEIQRSGDGHNFPFSSLPKNYSKKSPETLKNTAF